MTHEPSGAVLARARVEISATAAQLAGRAGDLNGDRVAATDLDGDGDVDIADWFTLLGGYVDGSATADLDDFDDDDLFALAAEEWTPFS